MCWATSLFRSMSSCSPRASRTHGTGSGISSRCWPLPLSASRSSTSRTMSSGPVPRFKTYSLRSRSPAWSYSCSHALSPTAFGGRMAARGTAPATHRLAVGAAVRTAPAALQRRTRAARRKIFLLHFLSRALSPFAAAREMDRYSPCIRKARSLLLRAFSSYSDTGSYSRPAANRAIISLVRATPLSR